MNMYMYIHTYVHKTYLDVGSRCCQPCMFVSVLAFGLYYFVLQIGNQRLCVAGEVVGNLAYLWEHPRCTRQNRGAAGHFFFPYGVATLLLVMWSMNSLLRKNSVVNRQIIESNGQFFMVTLQCWSMLKHQRVVSSLLFFWNPRGDVGRNLTHTRTLLILGWFTNLPRRTMMRLGRQLLAGDVAASFQWFVVDHLELEGNLDLPSDWWRPVASRFQVTRTGGVDLTRQAVFFFVAWLDTFRHWSVSVWIELEPQVSNRSWSEAFSTFFSDRESDEILVDGEPLQSHWFDSLRMMFWAESRIRHFDPALGIFGSQHRMLRSFWLATCRWSNRPWRKFTIF